VPLFLFKLLDPLLDPLLVFFWVEFETYRL
jgi:hypothetical protein